MLELNRVYNEDCLIGLKKIDDASIDCLITDPPYGTNDGKGKVIRLGRKDTNFSVIEWDKEFPTQWLEELPRIMKDDTWGVIFADNVFISYLWDKLEELGLKPRNTFYWVKYNKAPTPRSNFRSCVETAVFFTKGRTNQKWRGGGNQGNYLLLPLVSGKERTPHPTQKSVKVIHHFIKLITDENDIILDPFIGSGTTCVAAIEAGRKFIGFELDKNYYEMANERIDNTYSKQNIMF